MVKKRDLLLRFWSKIHYFTLIVPINSSNVKLRIWWSIKCIIIYEYTHTIHDNKYIELLFILMFYNSRRKSLRTSSYNKHLSIYIKSLISNKLGINILYTHIVTYVTKKLFFLISLLTYNNYTHACL